MKRIAVLMFMALMSLSATAGSIRYFTRSQADRTVSHLNAQNEVMIYCGYDYEIETYVLVNEVWAERVNSAYYELWIYGYDAYTGEEIYMPLDLECVWLYSAGHVYSAAQYLRFHASVHTPPFAWSVPPYNAFTRVRHHQGYRRTYHYDVHVYGWMPPAPPAHGYGPGATPPMHPYYMRQPNTPAPRPAASWTPGVERPHVSAPDAAGRTPSPRTGSTTVNTSTDSRNSGAATTGTGSRNSGTATTGTGSRNSGTATTGTGSRNSGTATTGTGSRNSGTATTGTGSRNSGSTTTGTGSRNSGTATTGTGSRNSGSTATGTGSRNSGSTTTGTGVRNTSNTPSRANTGLRSESGESKVESGERKVESVERKAESGERKVESVERKAESGERKVESSSRNTGTRTSAGSRNSEKKTTGTRGKVRGER